MKHCCLVLSTVSLQGGIGFDPWVCGVCMFSPCLCGFPLDTLVSSHMPKTSGLGLLATLNCPLFVSVSAPWWIGALSGV